ncbi:MAG: membrane protein insertion efficiency factor YidD [Deltaproteobacteria bacterium]
MLERVALAVIDIYQKSIGPLLPRACRFVPSCSDYARLAIGKYGFFRGGVKAALRILRCHPFSGRSGFDPLL